MNLLDYRPQSKLVTKTTTVGKPRFPAIDSHNHLGGEFGGGWDKRPLPELNEQLDMAGIVRYVDLDGAWGEDILNAHLDLFKEPAPPPFHDLRGCGCFGRADGFTPANRSERDPV